ncbi:MAG: seryl-tRNA synthetase [Parcubacteria group bacterium Greene0714_21]|nr:MAG: seryl-tRNA synthetase [Parcubacteria group bacterium Greene0416_39]TSC97649.1 MAG: seryl-tRNA synthetase [Parcubacteria group bacterium Greene1014_47]TSD03879.1 MAG: seryl-tRNA synthetase [Parcubacteria group bacterium Greene0714_21]
MIDIRYIRENPEKVKKACESRGVVCNVERILELDIKRRELLQEIEGTKAQQNKLGKDEIPQAQALKSEIKAKEPLLKETEEQLQKFLLDLPNVPQEDVPVGDESANIVVKKIGKLPTFSFEPKNHLELGEALGVIDVERATKVSGSRFAYIKGDLVFLEFALVRMAMDYAVKEKFIPVIPPVLIKAEMMKGMGYIDTKEDVAERYFLEKENMFLVGTAEQSVGPMHQGEIFEEKDLPKRYIAFSTSFREEAGSYGKDTKGILRLHQFDKVEMFSFAHPDKSKEEHQFLVSLEEKLWQALEIPYQVMQLATGDMARPSSSTVDIEAWLPGQNKYREVSSASNTTDFQARRLDIRFRSKDGKLEFVHMLNATGFAIGRTLIAILENYQQKDGSVKIPKVLQKYMGKKEIKR